MCLFEKIIENYIEENLFVLPDMYNNAVIGIATDFTEPRVIYSVSKCLEIIEEEEKLTEDEALEHFTFNISGSYVGEKTPIWCWDNF